MSVVDVAGVVSKTGVADVAGVAGGVSVVDGATGNVCPARIRSLLIYCPWMFRAGQGGSLLRERFR